uniref:NADH dehydrogenase [ubiquinone] 1 alpha subcomplex subunit 12 n=1 Tax=Onchocerca volvulus TaxID=6282 RepID=A0A8R1XUP9_ONCVO
MTVEYRRSITRDDVEASDKRKKQALCQIATLHSSDKKSRSRSSSPPNNDEKRQQGFFVGGSEQSGNLVLGPDSSRSEDIVSQFFNSARAHGAESLTPEENAKFGTRDAVKFASGSKGYRLGDTVQPSELVESNVSSDSVPQEVTLIMWENGFTVDDGPLRLYNDLLNHSFLQSISEGHIPNEIMRQYPGKTIDIRMERRYQPYVVKSKPFSGQGQRLGEIVPTVISAGNLEQNTSNGANPANGGFVDSQCVKKAQETIKLIDGEPITHVQIRLPSGGRIVGQFNHNHTVGDIRNFLVIAAPDYAFQPFNLMTTFPNKVIEQENTSLKEAGLLNAVIVVKLFMFHHFFKGQIPMSLKEIFGLRVLTKFFQIVKGCGGWIGFTKKRYLMDETRIGKFMGEDKFGNKYYEDNSYFMPRNRWVEYPEHVWLDYDASQIPAEWHMWLHHITDETPVQNPPEQRKWMLDHEETLTLLENRKYYPYSTTRQKLSLWNPKFKET